MGQDKEEEDIVATHTRVISAGTVKREGGCIMGVVGGHNRERVGYGLHDT